VRELNSGVPGFVSYAAFRAADGGATVGGGATVTVCRDKPGTDESSQRAAAWVRENVSTAVTPVVTEGDTVLHF
jgi:hypothetical protein